MRGRQGQGCERLVQGDHHSVYQCVCVRVYAGWWLLTRLSDD